MENLFCNKCNLSDKIPKLIAEEVLGEENLLAAKDLNDTAVTTFTNDNCKIILE